MINMGVDFGSTFTTISTMRNDLLEAILPTESDNSPFIPSVVSIDKNGRIKVGNNAKNQVGKKNVSVYNCFKMLLATKDMGKLDKYHYNYSPDFLPEDCAKIFLNLVLKNAVDRCDQNEINRLVVGAPEVWFKSLQTHDGRRILRNICSHMSDLQIKEVQIVSEPAAACAFFAYNYMKTRGEWFDGTILLVDFGGGTLDNSLAQITSEEDADGSRHMNIRILESNGMGENHEGRIGNAAVLYMHSVVEAAVVASGLFDDKVEFDDQFFKAVNEFEVALTNSVADIADIFDEIGIDALDELEEESFTSIFYKGQEIDIDYAMLVNVYDEKIRTPFEEKLLAIIDLMKRHGLNNDDGDVEDFKIALVGGFCNFYLVRKQVEELFQIGKFDKRMDGIITNRADCEKAISYGAALLAENIVNMRPVAPYSIALVEELPIKYAFRYRQDIEYDKVYYPEEIEPISGKKIIRPIWLGNNPIDKLVMNLGHDDETAMILPIKADLRNEIQEKMKLINKETAYPLFMIGFSLDASEVLSLHVSKWNNDEQVAYDEDYVIELNHINEMFETSRVVYVKE